MRSRSGAGNGTVAKASVRGLSPEKSTNAASAPSRLVPDIKPTNRATLFESGGRGRAHEGHGRARLGGHARELGAQRRRHGLRLRERHAQWILVDAGDAELVVQVRP